MRSGSLRNPKDAARMAPETLLKQLEGPQRRCLVRPERPRGAGQAAKETPWRLLSAPEKAIQALLGQPEGPQRCCSMHSKSP